MFRFRFLFILIFLLPLASPAARGQTISPVIAEYRGAHAQGTFQIRNDTRSPFTVVLRPMSFSVDSKGQAKYRPLDSTISLQLSANSFRVPPHRQFTVYYRVRVTHIPAWFTIYAAIVPRTRPRGLNLVIELPHTVYLLNKKSLSLNDVLFQNADMNPATDQVSAVVQNTSGKFGRVNEIEVSSNSAKQIYAGFPLFPGQQRVIHLRWSKKGNPRKIQLKFSKFRLDHTVRVYRASP